jgi:hypothetical protein
MSDTPTPSPAPGWRIYLLMFLCLLVLGGLLFAAGIPPLQAVAFAALVVGGTAIPCGVLVLAVVAVMAVTDTSKVENDRINTLCDARIKEALSKATKENS